MRNRIVFLLFILSPIFGLAFSSNRAIDRNLSANTNPTVTPTPDSFSDLIRIELDREKVGGSCLPGNRCSGNCNDSPVIIKVSGIKSESNLLRYNYTISGGRIVGEGAKVRWDLKGAQPGTYEIKVDVINNKSEKSGESAIKTVTVELCYDGGDRCLVCPEFSIVPPISPTQAGETMVFTANVSGSNTENMLYNWTVTGGKIIEGQGTPVIRVATNFKMAGKVVKATVNFKWDCSDICRDNTVSASSLVAPKKRKGK